MFLSKVALVCRMKLWLFPLPSHRLERAGLSPAIRQENLPEAEKIFKAFQSGLFLIFKHHF